MNQAAPIGGSSCSLPTSGSQISPTPQTCRLCGTQGPVLESHVLPAFVGRWLKETSATGFLRGYVVPDRRMQDFPTARLLCGACEQRFSPLRRNLRSGSFYPSMMGGYASNMSGGFVTSQFPWLGAVSRLRTEKVYAIILTMLMLSASPKILGENIYSGRLTNRVPTDSTCSSRLWAAGPTPRSPMG